jgi:hydroxymethylpyrimidine pyrophosphatase-like HAD family hydrolase
MDAEMYTRVGHKVFVVNAGAHLWMTADMRDVITQNYAQTVCQFRYQD